MKSPLVSFCVLAGFCGGAALRAATVDSTLAAVTVYADRAVVTRTASVKVNAAGPIEAVFERLPDSLLDNSLQVSGSGTARATILDVSALSAYVSLVPAGHGGELEERIRGWQRQRQANDDQLKLLADQEGVLQRIETAATPTPTKDTPEFSLENAAKVMTFLADRRAKLSAEQRRLSDQNEAIGAKRQAAERELADWREGRTGRGERGRNFKSVTVRLTADAVGTIELTLDYAVPNASWSPSYDARVSDAEHAVRLGYFGVVRQNTGEDWKDIDLTLSTARPSLGGAPPPLLPWEVDVFHPEAVASEAGKDDGYKAASLASFGRRGAGAPAVLNGGSNVSIDSVSVATPLPPAAFAQAQAEMAATSATFKVAVKATILSDNAPQKVPVASLRLPSASEYLAVPKMLTAAFLTDKMTNSSDFPFLAGEMNVFLDGTFVATSRLPTVMPGEKFDLALGADEGIALKRKLNRRFTEDTGLLTKGKRVTDEFTLSAQNNKKTAETLVLLDQVPVSRNEKVVIRVLAPESGQIKPDSDGTVKWTLTLAPGEKRELPLKFTIDYPSDVSVTGLD